MSDSTRREQGGKAASMAAEPPQGRQSRHPCGEAEAAARWRLVQSVVAACSVAESSEERREGAARGKEEYAREERREE